MVGREALQETLASICTINTEAARIVYQFPRAPNQSSVAASGGSFTSTANIGPSQNVGSSQNAASPMRRYVVYACFVFF
jgi:hypothetical protein